MGELSTTPLFRFSYRRRSGSLARPLARSLAGVCALVVSIAFLGGSGSIALAQPDGDAPADSKERDARARQLYNDAEADYAAGRYEQAATKFTEAYELSKRSGLLFNVANAYERMGEYRLAADNLKLYLKGPKVKDVVSVRERIRRLEAAIVSKDKDAIRRKSDGGADNQGGAGGDADGDGGDTGDTVSGDSTNSELPDPVIEAPRSDTKKSRFSRRRQVYALAGTSALALVGTVAFGLAARSAGADAVDFCEGGGGICLDRARSSLQSERQYAVLADLSLGVAVITAGTSLWLLLRSSGKREVRPSTSRVVPLLLPNGLGLGVSGAL